MLWGMKDLYLHLQAETGIIKAAWLRQTETRCVLFLLTHMNNVRVKC